MAVEYINNNNNNNNNDINSSCNWPIIFGLKQVRQYLSLKELIVVSTINKLFRNKLEGIIFKSLTLTELHFIKDSNYFMNYGKKSSYMFSKPAFSQYFKNLRLESNSDSQSIFKSTRIDPWVNDLRSKLKSFFQLTTCLKFDYFDKANYYIFPLTTLFNNLSQLRLRGCWVAMYDFYMVINSLMSLELLEVNDVRFVKLEEKELTSDKVIIPKTLKKLFYKDCFLELSSIESHFRFLFSSPKLKDRIPYDLPPNNLPNLKTLEYSTYSELPSFIYSFLNSNSQLTNLNIQTKYFNETVMNTIVKSNKLKRLFLQYDTLDTEHMERIKIPAFPSIDSLYVSYVYNSNCHIIEMICLSCPNLTKLHLNFPEFNIKFLNLIILKLKKLKNFRIESTDELMTVYDLQLFNIKYLTLCIKSSSKTEILLPSKKSKLTKIFIKCSSNVFEIFSQLKWRYIESDKWYIKLNGDWIIITKAGSNSVSFQ